jgi:hypothetical protein
MFESWNPTTLLLHTGRSLLPLLLFHIRLTIIHGHEESNKCTQYPVLPLGSTVLVPVLVLSG